MPNSSEQRPEDSGAAGRPVVRRIAMWSGPRNISTALMRSFESRRDTRVVDEPLYAHYLAETGLQHPGAAQILAEHDTDWVSVVRSLTEDAPDADGAGGASVFYQKHMAHHLLPSVGRDWLLRLRHAFLIREPEAMLPSLDKVTPAPRLEDTGLPQQVRLWREERERTGAPPPVIDSRDVLENPRGVLGRLCAALELPWDEAMLSWRPGPRATDGVWAPHWYAAVERSTGFGPYRPPAPDFPEHLRELLDACRPLYAFLHEHRLRD